MRVLLIVNAFASSVTARNTVIIHRRLSRDHEVELVETNRRGHATRFAADAARRGVDVVVGFGGDGTLNEVATGIAGTGAALGVLPGGSTNVFARTLGMQNDPIAAADQLAGGLAAETIAPIGLGRVNGRYFCFHAGVGFDASVVSAVERRGSLKRWLGHPLFMWAAASTWASGYDRSTPHFGVRRTDFANATGDEIEDGFFTIVLNTNPYTYLGNIPLDLSAAATLDRALVVMTFRTLRFAPVAKGIVSALRGTVQTTDELVEWTDVDSLTITSASDGTGVPYQLDGDYLGEVDELRFDHVPNAINLVFPGDPVVGSPGPGSS